MTSMDLQLIKIDTSHYWQKMPKKNRIDYRGKTYFDGYEKVDKFLSASVIKDHMDKKIVVAHSLINNGITENIVIDYNGTDTQRFYHRAQLLLREEGFINFTAFETTTPNHLHLYIHKGHTAIHEGYQIARAIASKLSKRVPSQWRIYPNDEIPPQFNILALPYEIYAKERGASWSKHM